MKIEQIYTGCLAEAAYYIESNGEAAIIDPLRETQPYLDKLNKNGAKLKYIFETHFHADFVSGHVDLAKKTGAAIVYGPNATAGYEIYSAKDNEEMKIGDITIKVLHTPGHTMESSTFLLIDENGKEHAIFSGDTLFLGDVGRPDLAIKQGEVTKEDLAGFLFESLRNKIMPLADGIIVYPGHGAGSACGKNLSTDTWGYLGEQKKTNYALRADMTKEEFVKEVVSGLTPPPQYFPKNAMMNKMGYDSFDNVLSQGAKSLSPAAFEMLVEDQEALMLDVRTEEEFAKEHIPNSIFIGLNGNFAPWVGALILDLKQPIVLITPEGKAEEAVTRLSRVGYDNTFGYLEGGLDNWKKAGKETDSVNGVSVAELNDKMANNEVPTILDVRKPSEFLSQHLVAATNFPLDYVNTNMNRLDRSTTYYLHCKGGYRSMITASILKSRGIHQVVDIKNGWNDLELSNIEKSNYVCPSTLEQSVVDEAVEAVI